MIPFKEVTHAETGVKQRIPWDRDRSRAKHDQMRNEVVASLNVRDIERAKVAGVAVEEGETVLRTMRDDGAGNAVVDPIASKVKHSGAETNDIFIPKWQEFCSRPQNDDGAEYPTVTYKPKRAGVVASPVVAKDIPENEKRRPGRPRKAEMLQS
jgi:hypothetical protein